jgi:DNA-binding NtrC family response regulator
MFSLASQKSLGRRILVIADEADVASIMTDAIGDEGGVALGPVASIDEALCYVATMGRVDCVMLEIRLATSESRVVPLLFAERQIETIFVTGHDDWFEEDAGDMDDEWLVPRLMLASA